MQASKTGIRGRMFRIKKTCARVRLLGQENEEARVDIAILRRILGIGIFDLRDVFRRGTPVNVDIAPMQKAPRRFQRSKASWNVVGIRFAFGESEITTTFSNPSSYFVNSRGLDIPFQRSRPFIRPDMTGRVVEATWQIFNEMKRSSIDVRDLLSKLKERFTSKELRVIHSDSKLLMQRFRRFFMTIPLYFTMRWGKEPWSSMISLHPGFSEVDIQKEIGRRAAALFRSRGRGGKRESPAKKAGVTSSRIPIIAESAKCAVVVETLLKDAAKNGMLIISLDCKGVVKDGKNDITLIQLATMEGEVWLFDVINTPSKASLFKEGRLKELLETDMVMKVMHDSQAHAVDLFRQYGVALNNVYDTLLAYNILLYQCNILPAEREEMKCIELEALCELLNEKPPEKMPEVAETIANNPHLWEERPLTEELTQYATVAIRALVPRVFEKLDLLMHPIWRQYYDCLCEDTLAKAQTTDE